MVGADFINIDLTYPVEVKLAFLRKSPLTKEFCPKFWYYGGCIIKPHSISLLFKHSSGKEAINTVSIPTHMVHTVASTADYAFI